MLALWECMGGSKPRLLSLGKLFYNKGMHVLDLNIEQGNKSQTKEIKVSRGEFQKGR